MFSKFGINLKQNWLDYHNFNIKCNDLLLADIFEKFRNRCLENYGLSLSLFECTSKISFQMLTCVISKSLPRGKFTWNDPKKFNLDKCDDNNLRGCISEVDLEYPKELHELHNDYPLAPDKLKIKRIMLPDYQLKIADDYNIFIGNVKMLVPNEKYVLHYNFI